MRTYPLGVEGSQRVRRWRAPKGFMPGMQAMHTAVWQPALGLAAMGHAITWAEKDGFPLDEFTRSVLDFARARWKHLFSSDARTVHAERLRRRRSRDG